jgi:hypothetical protein
VSFNVSFHFTIIILSVLMASERRTKIRILRLRVGLRLRRYKPLANASPPVILPQIGMGRHKSLWRVVLLAILGLLAGITDARAELYRTGQIVNNFTLYARRPFTNLFGRAFFPGSPVRLSDLAGYVAFIEFFDPT